MARLLRIQRAIRWMATSLTANRDALPFPTGVTDQINPVISIFGSQRLAEVTIATVSGALAGLEVFHTQVPAGRVRLYLSMHYTHDDPIVRALLPGRIIPTDTGFPFAGFRDQLDVPTNENFAVRDVMLGPLHRIACRANGMAAGARMAITVAWVEMPLGEYTEGIV